jgi:cation transport ATPase
MNAVVVSTPCATCQLPLDALRAARVRCFENGAFAYFCSAACYERFRSAPQSLATDETARVAGTHDFRAGVTPEPPAFEAFAEPPRDPETVEPDGFLPAEPEREPSSDASPQLEPAARGADVATAADDPEPSLDAGTLLLVLCASAGVLSLVLLLTGNSDLSLTARLLLVVVASGAFVAECVLGQRQVTELHPVANSCGPVAAVAAAIALQLGGAAGAGTAISLAGVIVTASALSLLLMRRARRPIELERSELAAELNRPAKRIVAGAEVAETQAADLRPGEEIVIEAGEVFPVDATITAGGAEVLPWLGAKTRSRRREGDSVVAGALVVDGRLRAVVGWAHHDRAFMRLTHDPMRRADLQAQLPRASRMISEKVAPFVAGFAALLAFAGSADVSQVLLLAIATYAALAQAGVAEASALATMRGVLLGVRRGIAFRSAEALDRAGRVSSVVFCARGTLLLGEPELTSVDALASYGADEVLAFAAGAETSNEHPAASAVLRAARARGVRPDAVRSPTLLPGLGVTAVAGSGQSLAVGTRALMLRERIGMASAEPRIGELEGSGRSVLLVALGGRLIGVIGLQDGLRSGARAAVQHVLDVGIEPVLLSGDARETCEAIGRALDIDHLRPEIPPGDRGDEIRRLRESGAVVAVIGRTPNDDAALSAADVSVALSAAGSGVSEWHIQLASDDVRDAAYSLRVARATLQQAQLSLLLCLGPALCGIVVSAFGFAPLGLSPVAAAFGTALAAWRLRRGGENG